MVEEIKLHFTHKRRIKSLWIEGYTIEEIAIMYKNLPLDQLNKLIRGIKQQERV